MAKKCPTLRALMIHAELTQQPLQFGRTNKRAGLSLKRESTILLAMLRLYGDYLMVFQGGHRVMCIRIELDWYTNFAQACALRAIDYLRAPHGDYTIRFGDYLEVPARKISGELSHAQFVQETQQVLQIVTRITDLHYNSSQIRSVAEHACNWSPNATNERAWQEQWWRDCLCAATEPAVPLPAPLSSPLSAPPQEAALDATPARKARKPRSNEAHPSCPKCGALCLHEDDVMTLFGYRTMKRTKKDGTVVYTTARQSWCKKCKRGNNGRGTR